PRAHHRPCSSTRLALKHARPSVKGLVVVHRCPPLVVASRADAPPAALGPSQRRARPPRRLFAPSSQPQVSLLPIVAHEAEGVPGLRVRPRALLGEHLHSARQPRRFCPSSAAAALQRGRRKGLGSRTRGGRPRRPRRVGAAIDGQGGRPGRDQAGAQGAGQARAHEVQTRRRRRAHQRRARQDGLPVKGGGRLCCTRLVVVQSRRICLLPATLSPRERERSPLTAPARAAREP
ncbi:hypothetical protein DMC30DRAFT_397261, partial [Rhodotorula diobovata]